MNPISCGAFSKSTRRQQASSNSTELIPIAIPRASRPSLNPSNSCWLRISRTIAISSRRIKHSAGSSLVAFTILLITGRSTAVRRKFVRSQI